VVWPDQLILVSVVLVVPDLFASFDFVLFRQTGLKKLPYLRHLSYCTYVGQKK
jgi:hypothetical protein